VKLDIPHTSLRTNGGAAEIIGVFPFMLSLVEAFIGFSAESQSLQIDWMVGTIEHVSKSWRQFLFAAPAAAVYSGVPLAGIVQK